MAGTVRLGREPSHQLPLPLASSIGECRIRAVKVTPAVLHCRVRPCVCRSTRGSCMLAGWATVLGRTGKPPRLEPSDLGSPLPSPPATPTSQEILSI